MTTSSSRLSRHRLVLVCLCGMAMLALLSGFWVAPWHGETHALRQLSVYAALFGLYLCAGLLVHRQRGGTWFWGLLLSGLLLRVVLVPLPPSLSDDLYRYIWDGRVQGAGINPFLFPPTDLALAHLRDAFVHPFINHAELRTVYPPVAQGLFWLAHVLEGSFAGVKSLLWCSEAISLVLLGVWLRRRGLPQGRLIWYAWCPLPMMELMLDGHLDGFAIPFLLAGLLAVQSQRAGWAGAWIAGAMLVKPVPLFMLPLLCWHLRWRRALRFLLVMALCGLLAYLPYLDAGPALFSSLLKYSKSWSFNGALYELLFPLAGKSVARGIPLLLILFFAFWNPWMRWLSFEARFFLPISVFFLCSPTLYPWYVVWLAPWLVLRPMPWLFACVALIPFAHSVHYFFLQKGVWALPPWLLVLEFTPIYLLLALQLWWLWSTRQKKARFA